MSKRELLDPHVVKLHQKPPSYHRRLRPLLYEFFPFSVFLPLLHTGLEPNPCIFSFATLLCFYLIHVHLFGSSGDQSRWRTRLLRRLNGGVHPCILYGLLHYDI